MKGAHLIMTQEKEVSRLILSIGGQNFEHAENDSTLKSRENGVYSKFPIIPYKCSEYVFFEMYQWRPWNDMRKSSFRYC
jgi:hypothetical protein